ncbi:hypothetical protein IP92_04773 [Pseudoduganella flava]|nr:hypothetical protein IP92_04773 [Pseudoduganella flava]
MRVPWKAVLAATLLLAASAARAGSPHDVYTLPWPDKKLQLTYHTCGCADSCWVAELRERRTKRLMAKLRCDCERLLFSRSPAFQETVVAPSCDAFNDGSDKNGRIVAEMKRLVDAEPASPIGSVMMLKDRTLVMDLRAETGGAVGHGQFVYTPNDAEYAGIVKHVGGLKPGEEKPVPPFVDAK